uniref:Phosphoglycerate mutase n=1 Tax=Panstrongylus megistus TaxID=65343 RepID=A0A069DRK2_9HEMI
MNKRVAVMVRHGESVWNEKNLFTGWYDADLSEKGVEEAHKGGMTLCRLGYKFDIAHTSILTRANRTLDIIKEGLAQDDLHVCRTWRLNERHYGALTGLNKSETAAKFGEEQVKIWRRSFDIPPPPMDENHKYYDCIVHHPTFEAEGPAIDEFPMYESLKMTMERTLPYWQDSIVPDLRAGKRVLIVAHGNSLRGIIKHVDSLSDETIMEINLPTGIPFLYEFDNDMCPVTSMKFLGSEEDVKKAMAGVAAQGKSK